MKISRLMTPLPPLLQQPVTRSVVDDLPGILQLTKQDKTVLGKRAASAKVKEATTDAAAGGQVDAEAGDKVDEEAEPVTKKSKVDA